MIKLFHIYRFILISADIYHIVVIHIYGSCLYLEFSANENTNRSQTTGQARKYYNHVVASVNRSQSIICQPLSFHCD